MREIKFRAWIGRKRKMVEVGDLAWYDQPIDGAMGEMFPKGIAVGSEYWPTDCELMQFIGLHDKNGKEIYEGDILKPPISEPPMPKAYNDPVVVEWHIPTASYILCLGDDAVMHGIYTAKTCEVIGNIHENPELTNSLLLNSDVGKT